jgi:hypothetical protein
MLFIALDQTTMAGLVYLNAVNTGNRGAAELLGDHYSEDKDWHRRFLAQDITRDMDWLGGAELSDVAASREQTLSGQWVTVVRFQWRTPEVSSSWTPGALRVKTDSWMFVTYVRAVELVDP